MQFRIPISLWALLFGAVISSGCASTTNGKSSIHSRASMDDDSETTELQRTKKANNFKVSVTSGGRPVNDFQQRLVHHIVLTKRDLAALVTIPGRGIQVPFKGTVEKDNRGGVVGVRLTEIRTQTVMPTLGFQDGDLITAVGKRHISQFSDIGQIATDIRTNGQASLTLQRDGKPHKLFYTLK